jgi:hypothetical protein
LRRALFLLGALSACSSAPLQSDWERAHLSETASEEAAPPPRYPRAGDLVPVDVPAPAGVRFFVDPTTLRVGSDHVVRYVLVGRSTGGIDNVTFEGLRCAPREFRVYALGRSDRTWGGSPGPWQTRRAADVSAARRALADEYFCADGFPVRDASEAVAALHRPVRARQISD